MRTRQNERLPAETTADRDARLQQMRTRQSERLAAETTAEREARHPHTIPRLPPRYTIYTSNHNIPLLQHQILLISLHPFSFPFPSNEFPAIVLSKYPPLHTRLFNIVTIYYCKTQFKHFLPMEVCYGETLVICCISLSCKQCSSQDLGILGGVWEGGGRVGSNAVWPTRDGAAWEPILS